MHEAALAVRAIQPEKYMVYMDRVYDAQERFSDEVTWDKSRAQARDCLRVFVVYVCRSCLLSKNCPVKWDAHSYGRSTRSWSNWRRRWVSMPRPSLRASPSPRAGTAGTPPRRPVRSFFAETLNVIHSTACN